MCVLDCHGVSGLFIKDQLLKVQLFPEQFSLASFIKEAEAQHFSLAVSASENLS